MKTALRIALLALLALLAVPAGLAVSLWNDGAAAIARAERDGALITTTAPLNTAERTIAASLFSNTWNVSGVPCRTFSRAWTLLVTPTQRVPGMPVSQSLSTALLLHQRHELSIRNDFQRLFVACQLEQRFSDTQMLRSWLDNAYFGIEPRGIDSAARALFNKSTAELDADESARLTALLYAPSLRNDPDRWTARADAIANCLPARPQ